MANCLINGTNDNSAKGVMIKILNFFVSKGFTPTMACAIAGNVQKESSYIPTHVNEIGCVGLFQWCYSRRDKIKAKYGDPGWKNIDNQLEFIWGELNGSWGYTEYKKVKEYFLADTNRTLSEYCYYWLRWMETPSSNENELRTKYLPERMAEANKAAAVYNQMNKTECNVGTNSGTDTSAGTFSCDDNGGGGSDELTSSVDVSESSQSSASGTSSNGSVDTTNSINTRPLFVGDSFALRVWNAGEHTLMRKTASALTKSGWQLDDVAKNLKAYTSNVNNKPKLIVVCCGYDHKFTNKVTWLTYKSDGIKKIKRGLRKILAAARGYDVKFIENLYPKNISCDTDYQYRAASIFNDAVQSLIDDGDEVEFTFTRFPNSTKDRLRQQETCVKSKKEATYTEKGFEIISNQICAAF